MVKLKDFKRGYKVNRNAQDWGRQQSTELRDSLQQHHEAYGDAPSAIPEAKVRKGQVTDSSGKQSAVNSTATKTARSHSSRSSDAGSYRGDGPRPSASRAASTGSGDRPRNRGELPTPSSSGSPRRSLANDVSDNHKGKQKVQETSTSMPPPPRKTSDTSSKRDDRLNRSRDTASHHSSSNSSYRSGRTKSEASASSRAFVASNGDRERGDHRRFRDRDDIPFLETRRSSNGHTQTVSAERDGR